MSSPSTSTILLTLYVCCETLHANYAYYAFHGFPEISALIIALLSEIFKLCIAAFFLLGSEHRFSLAPLRHTKVKNVEIDFRRTLRYAIPAALYLANNLIYYTVLPFATPSILQVYVLAKLPTTGLYTII